MRIKMVWRMLAAMVLVSLVPLAAMGMGLGKDMQRNLELAARDQLNLQADRVVDQIQSYMAEHLQVLKTTANLPEITSMDPAKQVPVLESVANLHKGVTAGINILGPDGVAVARSDGKPLRDLSQRAYFQETITGVDHFYQTVIGATDNKPTLIAAVPVWQGNRVAGVMFSNQSLEFVTAMVNTMQIGKTGYVWLIDAENNIMAHPDQSLVEERASMAEHEAVIAARAGQTEPHVVTEGGKNWLTVERTTPEGWILVLQMEEDEILAPVGEAVDRQIKLVAGLILAVILISVIFSQSLSRRIRSMATAVEAMANGDFTQTISVQGTDEIGEMAAALQQMQSHLGSHVASVQSAAKGVSTSAAELAVAADQASHSQQVIAATFAQTLDEVETVTQQQQAKLESTKMVIGELVTAVDQIANSATHQAAQVNEASQVVEAVIQQAEQVTTGMAQVSSAVREVDQASTVGQSTVGAALSSIVLTKERVDGAAVTVRDLGERSEAIGSILQEISAIAEQTNLLALNAAIEAARAGEAGRGFAVVAEEVRRLADRSVRSAQEIGQILAAVQNGVNQAVDAMEQGAQAAGEGADRANEAQTALDAIRDAVLASATQASRIQAAAEALLQGHQRLGQVTQTLAAVTEENSAAAEEMAAGSDTVRETVQDLDALALQSLNSIQAASGELGSISQAIERVVDMVGQLDQVSNGLAESVERFKA